ncbi:MAG: bifunctional 2-polyprenyl-6-hydroxyphenol methylase/3-demethylubiquinol 3-O-methyltransferase UbiG [Gammaproteobacteria bacterium]|nr:MAG: bifunctional 2-polyprenyl-6-hydroxyphenol methylase/3-demethylubiquinol 3-O-methyltransferase UbiG [Gammaproteobacteria bacterium]
MNNVDITEIEKFNKIASEWWDLNGKFKALHTLNHTRLEFIKSHAKLKSNSVIDVGCGGGLLSELLAKEQATITAIDMAEDSLQVAKTHSNEAKLSINYTKATAEEFSLDHEQSFDIVTCMEMLEHVPEPASVIKACATMLKPGGLAFFSTLNRSISSFLVSIVGAEYLLNLLPKGTHDFNKYIKPSELVSLCKSNNLNLISIKGVSYNPIANTSRIVNNLDVNYIAVFQHNI